MVKVNGVDPTKHAALCPVCGAKRREQDNEMVCPNADRKDHKGEAYHGRA